jgi:hypothetical protein
MCYCDARSFTAQRCVAQCAALYSPPRNFWVREQQNNQCYNDLKRYRRCARLLLSAQLIYIQLFSSPPPCAALYASLHFVQRDEAALYAARRGSIVRSTAQCPARRVAQENALHIEQCERSGKRGYYAQVLAAVSPSQV